MTINGNGAFLSILFFSTMVAARQDYTIEKYNHERDGQAIIKMLNDTPHYLRYESMGMPAGTTEKCFTNPYYITDVIRVNGKTIGFVNYFAQNIEILTFHIMRLGIIHLMGVDTEYQGQGYGKILFQHAIDQLKELKTPTIWLNAKMSNTKARNLYEKAGFSARPAGDDVIYSLQTNIPAKDLPQGNFIQRNPVTSLLMASSLIGGSYWAWNHFKQPAAN